MDGSRPSPGAGGKGSEASDGWLSLDLKPGVRERALRVLNHGPHRAAKLVALRAMFWATSLLSVFSIIGWYLGLIVFWNDLHFLVKLGSIIVIFAAYSSLWKWTSIAWNQAAGRSSREFEGWLMKAGEEGLLLARGEVLTRFGWQLVGKPLIHEEWVAIPLHAHVHDDVSDYVLMARRTLDSGAGAAFLQALESGTAGASNS